jgi:hypothetical protein
LAVADGVTWAWLSVVLQLSSPARATVAMLTASWVMRLARPSSGRRETLRVWSTVEDLRFKKVDELIAKHRELISTLERALGKQIQVRQQAAVREPGQNWFVRSQRATHDLVCGS